MLINIILACVVCFHYVSTVLFPQVMYVGELCELLLISLTSVGNSPYFTFNFTLNPLNFVPFDSSFNWYLVHILSVPYTCYLRSFNP